ncbi:MAG TPA: cytochrome d ubiquinol oxidase subunit II [Motilibacteraceae bacterium]|nr:cytochrome d ubiquinol oxidase subunit II [Motilibacteraceae bacterium]
MSLAEFWFLLIAILWSGYFLLEGFDFGVGMLLPVLGRDDVGRRVLINTIGPVWDANEVWVLVAGAGIFAAFPYWYATLFSGFYLPLLLILVALIVRGVAFEYRGKVDDEAWRKRWDVAIVVGSAVPALLWGVAFANIVRGVPIDAQGNYTGTLFTLLNPYGLLGGLVTLSLFLTHGAVFIALKTVGPVRGEARRLAEKLGLVTAVLAVAFLGWTYADSRDTWSLVLSLGAAVALLGALAANRRESEGWAFVLTAATIVLATGALFTALFPDVMPSTTDPAFSLTVTNASSTPYTLKVMSWVAVVMTPFVVAYQAWTYWVFRQRIGRDSIPTGVPEAARTQPAVAGPPEPR